MTTSSRQSDELQRAKRVVRDYYAAFDAARDDELATVLKAHTVSDYSWRGLHPFHEMSGADSVVDGFWRPLRTALASMHRREDVFLAGRNDADGGASLWVASMGHLAGLFDRPWLGIPPHRKLAFFRYAEFHRIDGDRIAETALFFDVVSMMRQAGYDALPNQTGADMVHPGPRTRDGVLLEPQDQEEGRTTLDLVNRMVADLARLNETGEDRSPPALLARTWHDDMVWYGPAGIGSTYTIARYQEQHQYPFRENLADKTFNGHVARIAEGRYAAFFGWPNLTNRSTGGFLGLPPSEVAADMRVVDVYRRAGDKLAENWVFIDLPHYLSMQGIDILASMRDRLGIDESPRP